MVGIETSLVVVIFLSQRLISAQLPLLSNKLLPLAAIAFAVCHFTTVVLALHF